jgi:hypothetical protein
VQGSTPIVFDGALGGKTPDGNQRPGFHALCPGSKTESRSDCSSLPCREVEACSREIPLTPAGSSSIMTIPLEVAFEITVRIMKRRVVLTAK